VVFLVPMRAMTQIGGDLYSNTPRNPLKILIGWVFKLKKHFGELRPLEKIAVFATASV